MNRGVLAGLVGMAAATVLLAGGLAIRLALGGGSPRTAEVDPAQLDTVAPEARGPSADGYYYVRPGSQGVTLVMSREELLRAIELGGEEVSRSEVDRRLEQGQWVTHVIPLSRLPELTPARRRA